jgi:hypothetical protein
MGVTQKAKDSYAKYKKFKKAKEYYKTVKNLIDEDTRSAEMFKQGLKYLLKIGEKALGTSLTKHPYYALHKVHLEVLGKALVASDTHHNAMKALHSAIASADTSAVIAEQVSNLQHRKNALKFQYAFYAAGGLNLLDDLRKNVPTAAKQLAEGGYSSANELSMKMEEALYAWRADACELYFDAMELLAMVEVEYKAASAAYAKYQEKVKKLTESKNSLDRIAGLGAERKRQYEWLERVMDDPRGGGAGTSYQAIEDPSKYAARQRDKVDELVQALILYCDVAMSQDAYSPLIVNRELGSL